MKQPRKLAAALLVAAGLTGAVTADQPMPPPDAVTSAGLEAFVSRRVQAWQPTARERRFDEIAWARDIREAERLAKKHHRPVFLFTHDGRMNIGRC